MLILASNSPRRIQLLGLGCWNYKVLAAQIDEIPLPQELPGDYVKRMAWIKTHTTHTLLEKPVLEDCVIIAADTAVVDMQNQFIEPEAKNEKNTYEILGKPVDKTEAVRMLHQLRGRVHRVYTGLAVLRPDDGVFLSDICATDVRMRDYGDDEITAYVASGDPLDKAGAYAIQGRGAVFIPKICGCYFNVVGLPLYRLSKMLMSFDVNLL